MKKRGRKRPKKHRGNGRSSGETTRPVGTLTVEQKPISAAGAATRSRSWLKQIIALAGVVATVATIWDVYWNTRPEIHALSPDASGPFTLPFAVKNPGHIFGMSNVTFYCGIKNVEMKPGSPIASMRGFAITAQAEKGKDIEPGDLRNYRCPLVAGPMSGVKSAEIGLYASYRTLWLDRRSPIFSLTWSADSVPPRWIEGD